MSAARGRSPTAGASQNTRPRTYGRSHEPRPRGAGRGAGRVGMWQRTGDADTTAREPAGRGGRRARVRLWRVCRTPSKRYQAALVPYSGAYGSRTEPRRIMRKCPLMLVDRVGSDGCPSETICWPSYPTIGCRAGREPSAKAPGPSRRVSDNDDSLRLPRHCDHRRDVCIGATAPRCTYRSDSA
jgi:hypothetical protein